MAYVYLQDDGTGEIETDYRNEKPITEHIDELIHILQTLREEAAKDTQWVRYIEYDEGKIHVG